MTSAAAPTPKLIFDMVYLVLIGSTCASVHVVLHSSARELYSAAPINLKTTPVPSAATLIPPRTYVASGTPECAVGAGSFESRAAGTVAGGGVEEVGCVTPNSATTRLFFSPSAMKTLRVTG